MIEPAAHIPQDQPPTGADGMIVCDRLVRIYSGAGIEVQALQGLDLLIAEGELTALIGAAGSGKSTLVNILAGLDTPTAGTVWVAGHNLGAMTAKERLAYRRSVAGFIWQQSSRNLLPYMTARQNVLLPMRLSSLGRRERRRRAGFLLQTLGIAHCADRTPDRMSGGEQQRAAIATALANQPKLLPADEPTGELDSATAQDVFSALQTANTELGVTMLGSPTTRPCRRRFAGRSRSGTARRAARRYGTRPPTSGARPRCTHASTRRWTGRAGFSSRAR
jgi:putative ABC transport system ATP-binding protein